MRFSSAKIFTLVIYNFLTSNAKHFGRLGGRRGGNFTAILTAQKSDGVVQCHSLEWDMKILSVKRGCYLIITE